MNGIIINIDPVIIEIGGFALRWYGLAVVLAVLAAVFVATREAKRRNIPAEEIWNLLPWLLIGGIAGARLFHILDQWRYYIANPLEILGFQQSGLAIWGALIGGGAAVVFYSTVKRISLGLFADILTPALLVGQITGRFGCIINGDAAGGITNLPWGFIYTNPGAMIAPDLFGVPTHPYPVYEMLWNLASLLVLLRLRRYFARDGLLFGSYALLYATGRFVLSFFRQESTVFWGLQQAQIVALGIGAVAVLGIVYLSLNKGMSFLPKTAVSEQKT
jgi:phosphatidylglycerol:prolipoprotein diacylglycerol transferase